MVSAVLGALLLAVPVGACTPCVPLTDAEKLQRADLVLVGVVGDRDSVFSELATVEVEEVVKGEAGETVPVRDPDGHPCLTPLSEGHRYRLFLVRSGDEWGRPACVGADRLTAKPVLAWWQIHDEWVALAAAGAVVTALTFAVLRIRRRHSAP